MFIKSDKIYCNESANHLKIWLVVFVNWFRRLLDVLARHRPIKPFTLIKLKSFLQILKCPFFATPLIDISHQTINRI